jgi:NitT/TauT family transport system permease protein
MASRPGLFRALRRTEPTLLPAISFALVIAVWEISADLGALDPFFFSSPARVVAAGYNEVQLPRFWNDVWISGQEFLVGYLVAVLLAVPFGLVTGWFRTLHDLFDPWLSGFNATPRLALLPLVLLWVGLGVASKMVIVFLGAFFPIAVNTFHGVRTVDANLMEVSSSFGASTWKRLTTVVLPAVLPFSLVGMRIGVGRAVSGVIVAEFFTAFSGLGYLIVTNANSFQTDRTFVPILVIAALGVILTGLLELVERRVVRWSARD